MGPSRLVALPTQRADADVAVVGGRSGQTSPVLCDDACVSQRDLAHLLRALWNRTGGKADVPVTIAGIDEDIGRGRGDMRTPLNLQALEEQGLVTPADDGAWALTPEGVARIAEDRELSDR